MPGERVNWGILGTGRMAGEFAAALASLDSAELLAVGSRTRRSAERFGAKFGVPRTYGGYASLAADPDLDVIHIATPPAMHRDNTLMCLDAGKAVLCEKPFAINSGEAQQMIDAARARQLFLMEAMWSRYIPIVAKLRGLVAEKAIGELQMILAGGGFVPEYDPDFYLFRPDLGGGVLLDAGVYLLSMASMILGPPERVAAVGELGETGVDVHDAILLQHEGGALANLYVSLRTRSRPDMTILGREGRIYVHAPLMYPTTLTVARTRGQSPDEVIEIPFESNGYQFEAMEVHRCLADGKTESDIMPLAETWQIMNTMDQIRAQLGLRYPRELQ